MDISEFGAKRLLVIFMLLAVTSILALLSYYYLLPQSKKLERDLRNTSIQSDAKRQEVFSLRRDFKVLEERLLDFRDLEEAGFFEDQNRLKARERIQEFRDLTGLLKARIEIQPGEVVENIEVQDLGYSILQSPVKITLEAQDDIEIYSFLKLLATKYPGHAVIRKLTITRKGNLDDATLLAIGSGVPTPLVTSDIEFDWFTMPASEGLGL